MTDPRFEEKIYLTYKTRMTTEARLRRKAITAYVFLCWYSIVLIVFSLLDLSNKFVILNFSIISASVSIVMLAASMFIYGERYTERADQFRNCYLQLQALYESSIPVTAKMERYSEILARYENQSDTDYDNMMFDAYIRGQSLNNAHGPVAISCISLWKIIFERLRAFVLMAGIFFMPVIFYILWVKPI